VTDDGTEGKAPEQQRERAPQERAPELRRERAPRKRADPFEALDPVAATAEGDPFEAGLFEERAVVDSEPGAVWEVLERGGDTAGAGTRAQVSKHSYCEQCEFFSEPPAVECHHEGTEIVEFPDVETVCVVDCPVVAERRAAGRE